MSNDHPQPLDAAEIPRFAGIPTFMRLPAFTDPAALQVGLIGVPWDGGTTNRAGARHGPREVRNLSSLMRKVHHVSRIAPYDLVRVGDLGDAPVNPIDLLDSLRRIEGFYRQVHAAGTLPLSVGGDHLVTLPIFRALGRERPLGMCSAVAVLARIWKINDAVEMAPEDAQPIEYQRKLTRRGLGFTQARSSQTGGIASASQHPKYLQALAGRTSEYPTRRRLAQVARLSCAPNRHGTPGSSLRTYHPVLAEGH